MVQLHSVHIILTCMLTFHYKTIYTYYNNACTYQCTIKQASMHINITKQAKNFIMQGVIATYVVVNNAIDDEVDYHFTYLQLYISSKVLYIYIYIYIYINKCP